ncbi:MAG: acetyltransferase [Microbacterium sp.]|nr:acetyltransferase [Microbacterium sp.]
MNQALSLDLPRTTPRLVLRPHRADDLEQMLEFHSDPEVTRFIPWPVRDREATRDALAAKIEQGQLTQPGSWLVLAIEERDSGRLVGEVLLKWVSAEHRQGEIGFVVSRAFQGKGYATEAAGEMLRLGFDELGLHRVTAACLDDNHASARALRRLGFSQEGRFVDELWFKGAWTTRRHFALTEDTWRVGGTSADDQAEIESLIRCFFDAFRSDPGVDDRMVALRAAMLPGARIVRTGGAEPMAYDIDSFLEPRRVLLTDGTLTGFREEAQSGRLDLFGDMANWFGRYSKQGIRDGKSFDGGGMKSMQFVRTAAGWRISASVWDDDRP